MEVRESQKQRSEAIKVAKSQTLCWDCKHATDINKCPWARDFTPVDGWWAVPHKTKYRLEATPNLPIRWREEDTYCVLMCPLFERTSYRAGMYPLKSEKHSSMYSATDADIRKLVAAIIAQAVDDWERLERGRFKKTITAEGVTIKSYQLIEFFNSRRFAAMLEAVSTLTPKKVREVLEVPDAKCY